MAFPFLQDIVQYFFGLELYLPIPTFGMLVGIACLVSFWLFGREVTRFENTGLLQSKLDPALKLSTKIPDFAFYTLFPAMLGARLFHILEYPAEFAADPLAMIFSRGGFTVIGGLFFGILAGVTYLRRRQFPILQTADAAAPALMLGYSIGRIGCQLSGDGDWGTVANMALKPAWLPSWLWSQTYQNNIIHQQISAPGVYPTPLYESVAAMAIFLLLWRLRKHPFSAGWLFSCYLFMSGIERLLIEQIRVNSRYTLLGFSFTQAEVLSSLFILLGLAGIIYFARTSRKARVLAFSALTLAGSAACSHAQFWSNRL